MKNVPICNIFHRFESNLWSSACLLPYYFLTTLSYNSSNTIYWSVICYWCMYSCRRASCMNHTIISRFLLHCWSHLRSAHFPYKFQHVRFHWSHYSRSDLPAAYSPMKLLFHSFSGKWNCVEDSIQNAGKSSLWTQSSQHLLTSFQIIAILTYTHKK